METPTTTYRIQVNPSFGFRSASAFVPYPQDLGKLGLYGSPIFNIVSLTRFQEASSLILIAFWARIYSDRH
jgi:hypothetical protein